MTMRKCIVCERIIERTSVHRKKTARKEYVTCSKDCSKALDRIRRRIWAVKYRHKTKRKGQIRNLKIM